MSRLVALLVVVLMALPAAAQPSPAGGLEGSIAGRVLRPDGIPQPDADVVTAARGADGRLRLLPWRARTRFDGRYDIHAVPPGRYLVLVPVVGGDAPMPGRPSPTLFPGVSDTEPGTPVEVFPGVPVEGVDIWLLPSPRRFHVSGRVVDHEGNPVDDVSIEFGRPRSRADSVWTVTEPGGLFALSGIPPGPLVLRARAGPLIGIASTELAIESAQDLRIVVREPSRVRGQVRAPAGAALPPGVRVALVPLVLGPSALYPPETVEPDAAGRFELGGAPGEHEVRVEGLPPGWVVRRVHQGTSAVGLAGLWLRPGAVIDDVRVELGVAPAGAGSSR